MNVGVFVLRRVFRGLVTLWFVLTLVFVGTRSTGDPTAWLLPDDASEEMRATMRVVLGVDKPLLEQYRIYVGNVFRLDFGTSFYEHRPVTEVFVERLPATLKLMGVSLAIAVLLGPAIGMLAAINRNGWLDRLLMSISFSAYAVPNFVLGIVLILIFSLHLQLLPSSGMGSWRHFLMPAFTLGASNAALLARLSRSSMLDVLNQDYIRTARSKGLAEVTIVTKHALRNAFIPVLTVIGLLAATLVGGSVVIESVFAWPGAGRLIVNAVLVRDFPVLQVSVLAIATAVVISNLVVDMTYALLDPRIQLRGN